MEDATIFNETPAEKHSLFAVFDGHGGDFSSRFAELNFTNLLISGKSWPKYLSTKDLNVAAQALQETFLVLDEKLAKHQPEGDHSGSTALVLLVTPAHERLRIISAGGSVRSNRVDGILAVSRAFGDFEFKNCANKSVVEQKVIPEPDIKIFRREGGEVLIIACDGIWDVVKNAACVDMLLQHIKNENGSIPKACEKVLDECLDKGSTDNMSLVALLCSS